MLLGGEGRLHCLSCKYAAGNGRQEEQRASDPALLKGPLIPTSYFTNKTQQVGKIHDSYISFLLSLVMTSLEIKTKQR